MDCLPIQRKILFSLYHYGYIGNWYKSPNKIFLKVYLADETIDANIRLQFDSKFNIIDDYYNDPMVPFFQKSVHRSKFDSVVMAIEKVVPGSFEAIRKTNSENSWDNI